ncbi:lysophospholipid acyltransferase family protein [Pedobacter endophyticus]|uniref:Lysophospholipid acyltransferase family protein n=1 Tax=Pedobacter endophyticus TaxID=2789740 RepID=A0A7U3Q3I4_9SPHI|nr:lysophospholipid acyltransferase family protein [Pedobacter endophyticus]QPH37915.1 lysophospholipid acyltransferase family protein [Pedobacter endophyticus]
MIKKGFSLLGIFFLGILSLLPLSILYLLADVAYFGLYRVFGYRKKVVRQNLLKALPEKQFAEIIEIEKRFYKYLASLIFEVVKMNSISKAEIKKRFVFKNKELVQHYLDRGQSVLFCSAHYGNWEWGTMGIGLNFNADHYPIYKPLSNPVFDNWFKKTRSKFGNNLIAMRQTIRVLTANKDKPGIFSFGNDQAPARNESHYWTTFLHQQASIQLGIEKIAKKTNQPIFYLKVTVLKRGFYEVDCVPLCLKPKETAEFEITELHTRFLEGIIRSRPEYWLWSHRRWKYRPREKSPFLSKVKQPGQT